MTAEAHRNIVDAHSSILTTLILFNVCVSFNHAFKHIILRFQENIFGEFGGLSSRRLASAFCESQFTLTTAHDPPSTHLTPTSKPKTHIRKNNLGVILSVSIASISTTKNYIQSDTHAGTRLVSIPLQPRVKRVQQEKML